MLTFSSINPWALSYSIYYVKNFFPLEFLQFHTIFMLVWNEFFCWLHNIWGCNDKTLLLSFFEFILPHPSPILWLLRLFHIDSDFFLQYNGLLPPPYAALCWDIVRTTCYQSLSLVTCRVNSWRHLSSTRACWPLLLMRNKLLLVAKSWYHTHVTLSLPSFNLFQNVTVDRCDVDLIQWNKGQRILFLYSWCRSCCNILDTGFCDLHVVLQWKYNFYTVLLELHKFIVNHWTPDVVTFW